MSAKQHSTDKLQLSPAAFQALQKRFNIFSRFAGLIHIQMQPSRKFEYDPKTGKLARVQFVYSNISRSINSASNPKDPTKRVLDWRRVIVWSGYDLLTGHSTIVALRCPSEVQERMVDFGKDALRRQQLLRHPILVHTSFAQHLSVLDTYFSKEFAAPIYHLVSFSLHSCTTSD